MFNDLINKMTYEEKYIITKNCIGYKGNTYAQKGDKVVIVALYDTVAIVENERGERFSVLIENIKKKL